MKPVTLFLIGALLCAASASAQDWRLVNSQFYRYQNFFMMYRAVDSINYNYAANTDRTSTYNNDSIAYDERSEYRYGLYSMKLNTHTKRAYDAANRLVCNELYQVDVNGVSTLDRVDSFFYTGTGKVGTHKVYDATHTGSTGMYTLSLFLNETNNYNGKDNITQKDSVLHYSASVTVRHRRIYLYDANDRLVVDSMLYEQSGSFQPVMAERYTYNAAGNVANRNTWHYTKNTPAGVLIYRHPYVYDATARLVADTAFYKEYDTLSGGYVATNYGYDAAGILLSDTLYSHSFHPLLWQNDYVVVRTFIYTSFGYVDSMYVYNYLHSGNRDTSYYKYKYAPHWPVNTQSVSKQADELTAYPVPSSNFVNIKWHTDMPVQVQGRIVNMQGQAVQQWSDNANGDYYKSVHTANLPAGNYYIVLHVGDRRLTKNIVITK